MAAATLIFMAAVVSLSPVVKPDLEREAAAIAIAETATAAHPHGDDAAVGGHGERGRYQFQKQLWQQISYLPFEFAHDPVASKRVALRALEWLERRLRTHQDIIHSRVYLIALAWHAGPQAVLHLFATKEQKQYAERVEAIYETLPSNPIPK